MPYVPTTDIESVFDELTTKTQEIAEHINALDTALQTILAALEDAKNELIDNE